LERFLTIKIFVDIVLIAHISALVFITIILLQQGDNIAVIACLFLFKKLNLLSVIQFTIRLISLDLNLIEGLVQFDLFLSP
jgi:hypothetical protein